MLWRGTVTGCEGRPKRLIGQRTYPAVISICRWGITYITVVIHKSLITTLTVIGDVVIYGLISMEHFALLSPSSGYSVRDDI